MLGIELGGGHGAFEVEAEPLLDAGPAGALGEIEQEREVENDGRGEDRVAAEEVDLHLHRIAAPAEEVDVVPSLFGVAARRVVFDPDFMKKISVETLIGVRLKDVVEDA